MTRKSIELVKPKLAGIPETMLWTLHNRANEAMRKDGIIKDDKAIEIYKSIHYDFEKNFGKPEPSHALRAIKFDQEISAFLKHNPNAYIINLGEGLETQRYRLYNDEANWISIDLPEAIEIRERFIQPDNKHQHCPLSFFDRKWFDLVPKDVPVFITAQGLFMYFNEKDIKSLFIDIFNTFQEGYLMFDTISVWLSKKTMSGTGWKLTKYYTTPGMPWGINRNKIKATFRKWSKNIVCVEEVFYLQNFPKGIKKWYLPTGISNYMVRNRVSTSVKILFKRDNNQA